MKTTKTLLLVLFTSLSIYKGYSQDTKALEATLKLLKDAKIVNGALTNQDEVFLQLQKDLAILIQAR